KAPHLEQQSVYMITSACSGEGKTSITVALGLSFAASGYKTVMIDCDLVGRGLTRGYKADGIPGLREALGSGTARGIVKKTDHGPRLISAGNADSFSGWTLSPGAMANLIAEARHYYDVVIIDTGPVLGSVEAAIVAPEVDGVIVAISRGQQRTLVERALRQLGTIGAKPIGFIFNRARPRDFQYSAMHSSARMASVAGGTLEDRIVPAQPESENSEVASFGPLVRSVARFLRPSHAAALTS
ncbi:MAG TPA: CpsD/CapB family tyrosine-protein kinase, partial [Tepidisphaeraceae bacterium]